MPRILVTGIGSYGFVSAAATAVVKTTVISTLENSDFTCKFQSPPNLLFVRIIPMHSR